jgi:hypothetical protein
MKNTIQNAIKVKDLKKLDELQKLVKQSIVVKRGFLNSANITVDNKQGRFSADMQEKAKKSAKVFEKEIKEYEGLVELIKRGKTAIRK